MFKRFINSFDLFLLLLVIQNGTKCSEGSRVHPLIKLRYVTEILQSSVVQSTELPSLSTDRHLVYPLKASFAPSREGRKKTP